MCVLQVRKILLENTFRFARYRKPPADGWCRLPSIGSEGSPVRSLCSCSVRNILASSGHTAVHLLSLDYKLRGSYSIDKGFRQKERERELKAGKECQAIQWINRAAHFIYLTRLPTHVPGGGKAIHSSGARLLYGFRTPFDDPSLDARNVVSSVATVCHQACVRACASKVSCAKNSIRLDVLLVCRYPTKAHRNHNPLQQMSGGATNIPLCLLLRATKCRQVGCDFVRMWFGI